MQGEQAAPLPTAMTASMTGAGLAWPVKSSFAQYVGGLVDGWIELAGPAMSSMEYGPIFRLLDDTKFDRTTMAGTLGFGGAIRFQGHFGLLRLVIADPWLAIEGSQGLLSVATGLPGRMNIATCQIAWDAQKRIGHGTDLALMPAAVELFGGAYQAGTSLDPFLVQLGDPAPDDSDC